MQLLQNSMQVAYRLNRKNKCNLFSIFLQLLHHRIHSLIFWFYILYTVPCCYTFWVNSFHKTCNLPFAWCQTCVRNSGYLYMKQHISSPLIYTAITNTWITCIPHVPFPLLMLPTHWSVNFEVEPFEVVRFFLFFYLISCVISFLGWYRWRFLIADLLQQDKTDCYIQACKQTTQFQNIRLRTHVLTSTASPYMERTEHCLCKPC